MSECKHVLDIKFTFGHLLSIRSIYSCSARCVTYIIVFLTALTENVCIRVGCVVRHLHMWGVLSGIKIIEIGCAGMSGVYRNKLSLFNYENRSTLLKQALWKISCLTNWDIFVIVRQLPVVYCKSDVPQSVQQPRRVTAHLMLNLKMIQTRLGPRRGDP